jgi:hypothetical protein
MLPTTPAAEGLIERNDHLRARIVGPHPATRRRPLAAWRRLPDSWGVAPEIELTIPLRAGVDVASVRASLTAFSTLEGGVMRLDRPIREIAGGRHFHVAAPDRGSGTIEVNFEPTDLAADDTVRIVLRRHWTGTWAGDASLRLADHIAKELGAP